MGVSDTTEADWEEYYRNVNAFNIPNADAKRVEIWDKAFLSTKTVRETLWEVYSKGFMDGVNDTSERYKNSAYRQKHDSELLDKVAEKFVAWDSKVKGIREDGVCFFTIENILKGIEELKAEMQKGAENELYKQGN